MRALLAVADEILVMVDHPGQLPPRARVAASYD
jgi:hypothetical protein